MMPHLELLWQPRPQQWPLTGTDVHVWAANLEQPATRISSLQQILSRLEQARAAQFKFEKGRNQFITGRSLLRTILGSYLQLNPAQLRFQYNARGKPSLESSSAQGPLHFNVAHSKDLILIAVTRACPVGVDVEHLHPVNDFKDIAARFFTSGETTKLISAPADQQMVAFFNLWTRKEAYLKATGDGISGGLKEVEISCLPEEPAQILAISKNEEAAKRWTLSELNPAHGYAAAVAAEAKDLRLSCWQWPL